MPTTINSAVYDAQYGENPRYRLDNAVLCAELRNAEIEYVFKGTEAAGDTINLVQLPKGAQIYPEHSAVISEGVGAPAWSLRQLATPRTSTAMWRPRLP